MNILELLFGQIPEAIYFALFLILTKQLMESFIKKLKKFLIILFSFAII